MADFLVTELKAVGADAETKELNDKKLPHVVVARYPANPDSSKRTILIYGHYDVQPKGEGWKHEPFKMKEEDGKLFGRGSTDDKGPVIAWINVIEAYKKSGVQFPVNVRFCFEGMEESGSTGLPEFLDSAEGKQLFDKVDAGCISDNYWLGTKKPCLTYGLRGINYFSITVSGPPKQLHSGIFGGSVYEPLTDLIILLSKLVDSQGKILVPGIEKIIEPLTDEEKKLYDGIDYSLKDFNDSIGPKSDCGIYNDPKQILMARWRYPSLSIHGISGAYSGDQTVTSIPPNVTGKFSIRTVPNMTNDRVTELVKNYLNVEFEKLNSKNHLTVKLNDKGEWWRTDPQAQNFKAAVSATRDIWEQVIPDLTREGGR
jgi:Cys-Gly metallodipeptidase DUG1